MCAVIHVKGDTLPSPVRAREEQSYLSMTPPYDGSKYIIMVYHFINIH